MTRYTHGSTNKHATGDEKQLDDVFKALASPIRRRLLPMIFEAAPSTIAVADLASAFATSDDARPIDSADSLLVALHHRHLPLLSDADLISYDDEAKTVTATVDPTALEDDIRNMIEFPGKSAAEIDAVFSALANPRRRRALRILTEQTHPVTVESVAVDLTRDMQEGTNQPVSTGSWDRYVGVLTHSDLPKLDDAGLIDYDPETGRVAAGTGDARDSVPIAIAELSTSYQQLTDEGGESEPIRAFL